MAMVSPTQAEHLTGVGRSTIYRDMADGVLSYTKNTKGRRQIDTSELERVYGQLNTPADDTSAHTETPIAHSETVLDIIPEPTAHTENQRVIESQQETIAILQAQVEMYQKRENRLMTMLEAEQEQTKVLMLPKPTQEHKPAWNWFGLFQKG